MKFNEDNIIADKHLAAIGGVSIKEMILLEHTFLEMIDYKLLINQTLYNNYFSQFVKCISNKTEILNEISKSNKTINSHNTNSTNNSSSTNNN